MVVRAHIQNGQLILDEPLALPDGTEVDLSVSVRPTEDREEPQQAENLLEQLREMIGSAEGLPSDYAEQHDHYLYGTPKR